MVCWRCGYEVAEGAASCQTCGAEIGANAGKQHDTQPIPAPDATVRMPAMTSVPVPADAATTILSPATAATPSPSGSATGKIAVPGAPKRRGLRPLMMLFAAGVVIAVGGVGVWQIVQHRTEAAPQPAAAAPASAATPAADAAAPPSPAPVTPPAADPATAPAPASPATAAAAADTSTSGPGSGPALLAATRKERDAAIVQRDAALAEIKQLQSDLARARASAPAPVVPAAPPADTARVTQLQKDHDTLRFIVGSRKQLQADKVIESHLYLLPPPAAGLTPISLADTTEIAFDGKTYGMNNVKDVVVIPSSVWENTDYKYTVSGSAVRFTILKPDAFRTFAKYFVLMIE